jgi:hypothetical protein
VVPCETSEAPGTSKPEGVNQVLGAMGGEKHADETATPSTRSDRRRRARGQSRVACGGRAVRDRCHTEAAEVGRGLARAPGPRRPGWRQELHDRSQRVNDLEIPQGPAAHENVGLLVRQPASRPAVSGPDDRGDQSAERQHQHVRDDPVAQPARQRIPAERSDPLRRGDAGRAGPDRHPPPRRREPSTVRRHPAAVVHGRRREGPALHHRHVHLLQRTAGKHGLVPRPRPREHPHERLCRARRGLPHPGRPGHGRRG